MNSVNSDNSAAIQADLRDQSVPRLIIKYSGPAIIETVAVSLYNIIDSVFIGHDIGAMALSAMAIALPLMNLVVGFCTLVSAGGAAMMSIYLGRKDMQSATRTVNNVMLCCLVHSVIFGGLMFIYLDPILTLFGATDATRGLAHSYMRIILIGTPISYVFIGLNNMMRASGYPVKAMISALLSVAVNVAVCPVFVNVLHWGMEGAALATVLGQTAAFVWCLYHFLSPKSLVRLNVKVSWFNPRLLGKIYSIGLSPFLMNCAACIVVVFLNRALLHSGGSLGNYDIGAYGVLNRITMVFVMVVQGLTMGMQPVIGYNFGAGNWSRVRATLRYGIFIGVAITTLGWALTELFPDRLTNLFTYNHILESIDRTGFRIYFIVYPVVGAQIVIQNFFQYIDRPVWSIALSLTRQLIFLLPCLFLLPRFWGVDGVWASMAVSDMLAFLAAVLVLVFTMRRYNRQFAAPSVAPAAKN